MSESLPAPAAPTGSNLMSAVDSRGRKLLVKEMDPADQLDLFEACAKNSNNSSWVGMALLVCSVTAIDDVPVMMPKTPQQVKDLARRLGSDGIEAVGKALNGKEATDGSETVELAKN